MGIEAGDGLVVNNTNCSSRGPGFSFQCPHGGSQLSIIPVPQDPNALFWPLQAPYACGAGDTCGQNVHNINLKEGGIKRKWELRWVAVNAFNPRIRKAQAARSAGSRPTRVLDHSETLSRKNIGKTQESGA